MKTKSILLTGLALAALSVSAQAANEVISITGATAFRQAATTAINEVYRQNGNFISLHNGGLNAGGRQIWRGTFGSLGANVTIRTAWNGSTEGIRAVATPSTLIDNVTTNPSFFKTSVLTGFTGNSTGNNAPINTGGGNTETAVADMAFSDVQVESTPIDGSALSPTADSAVGVVTFTMMANKSWRTDLRTKPITNITSQQFRTLCNQGKVSLSLFTGNPGDTEQVYLSGRNDGSGTRTVYLAESGFGFSKPITDQYVAYDRSNTTVIPSILLVPKDGGFLANGTATPTNRSTVWGQNLPGNGGYNSGGELRDDFRKTTGSTAVFQFADGINGGPLDGNITFNEAEEITPAAPLFLLTVLSTADAASSRGTGTEGNDTTAGSANAIILGYEGYRLTDLATTGNATLGTSDRNKLAQGQYTMWSFQNLYYVAANTTSADAFVEIKGAMDNVTITSPSGMTLTEMQNLGRTVDGGIISK